MNTQTPGNNVAVLKPHEEAPPKLPALPIAGGRVMALIPATIDEAWRIANVAFKGGICPKDCTSPENAMTRVLHGMEVGLPPMAAIQSIAVINGRPTIWGDAAIGLIRASGKCRYIKEFEEVREGGLTAVCRTHRIGEDEPTERTWSVKDEQVAGLANKDIHKAYPARMRQMRARAFCLRDAYADVLKGLGFAEEVQDYDDPIGRGRADKTEVQQTPEHRANPDPFAPVADEPQAAAAMDAERQIVATVEVPQVQIPLDGDIIGRDGTTLATVAPTRSLAQEGGIPAFLDRTQATVAPAKAEMAADPNPCPAAPEAILAWIEKRCAASHEIGALQMLWEHVIEPEAMAKLEFPPDVDAAQGILRKHEKRLGGD